MKISISTIKKDKVFGILYGEDPKDTGVTKQQFEETVKRWIPTYFQRCYSTFTAVEQYLYSMIIVLDINNDHDLPQQDIDI